jgi:glucose/arabinose dehydrogenase
MWRGFTVRRRLATLLATGALVAGAAPVLLSAPATAATFPAGFTDTTVSSNLDGAIAAGKLPDGRLIVARRGGTVTVLNTDGTGLQDVLNLSVCQEGEQGLLGIAVDPQFATNHNFYVYYTFAAGGVCGGQGLPSSSGSKNRVSRFTLNGASADGTESIVLDNLPEWPGNNHNGGDLHIPQDGLLYVAVGDGGGGRPATNPTDLGMPNGKILRVNLDGTPAAGNPFGSHSCKTVWAIGGPACGEIYARGLRNPFRLGFKADGPTVKFRIDDVGQSTTEEVDDAIAGADYGWPDREGPCPTGQKEPCPGPGPGITDPVLWYTREGGCETITGGAFVPDGLWAGYNGSYLFADFACGHLFVQQPGQGGATFDTLSNDVGSVVSLDFLPENGSYALYYTDLGSLHRVTGPPASAPPPIEGLAFTAVSPTRLLDTRSGLGTGVGKLSPGSSIALQATGGVVPADAKAVVLNLTATLGDGPGFVTAWPAGQSQPPTSSLNLSVAGETAANAVVVPVGAGGQVNLMSSGGTHLVADVTGYFTTAGGSAGGRFHATPQPARLLDTRNGTGGKSGPFASGETFDLQVAGQGGLPATGVTAVALTVTYTGPTAPGYLTVWPSGEPQPVVSTTNPNGPGDIRSNLALVKLGANGKVSILSFRPTDVVVDVVGYFSSGSGNAGLFTAITPSRVADSRQAGAPFGRLASGTEATMDFTNFVSSNATGALYNLTATNTVGGGFLTAHPAGTPVPGTSSVNWSGPAQNRAALTISSLASQHKVGIFDFSDADAIIDLAGWFTG